ncbi:hypothetical protein FQA47_016093 [Oryzias melastigma]|uniref:Uncharacterized protein n=1 Tax=Oryzias melastigma TaxID=30732 RepID=A0A834FNW1_ORYME|nr:hypothetical protein FQA47_016093 [Oryzias melastigma]
MKLHKQKISSDLQDLRKDFSRGEEIQDGRAADGAWTGPDQDGGCRDNCCCITVKEDYYGIAMGANQEH